MDAVLYSLIAGALSVLIYRYARYSNWSKTDAGRSFMAMKVSLLLLFLYFLAATVDPGSGEWRALARAIVASLVFISLLYQNSVVIRRQGGWRNRDHEGEPSTDART